MKPLNLLLPLVLLCHFAATAQVGINNTTPKATLDITATNQATPANTDGILIPRIDAFPANNPTADQQGMMVYLTTASGSNTPGFYYWDNASTTWIAVSGAKNTLDQAYDEGGAGSGRTIIADNGAVAIDGGDGFQVTGTIHNGSSITLSGIGTRMFFNPKKGAFRAGDVVGNYGFYQDDVWNDVNVGKYSFAGGSNTKASGEASTAFGKLTTASGAGATAMGNSTTASGVVSTAIGYEATASGYGSVAIGYDTAASGSYSNSMGNSTASSGDYSTSLGNLTTASGESATATGRQTTASGDYSTSMGISTTASGESATAMGRQTTASGDYSTSMGFDTTASGQYSISMGSGTTASVQNSIAMGGYTTASGPTSTAMGSSTTASGSTSTAMGSSTTASGPISTAMGASTTASGSASTAMGEHTTAYSYAETAIGSYNKSYFPNSTYSWDNSDRLFVIGNGTDDTHKSNALTIYKNGLMNINDAYNMPLTDGSANQIMATDGSGNISFVDNFKNTLDQAYDEGGAGVGRIITADNGAVEINGTDGFQVTGNINHGSSITLSGIGTRMFFNPKKGAFRAGNISGNNTSNYFNVWDDSNVGYSSFASGESTEASGSISTAFGVKTVASGSHSTALGQNAIASGFGSIAMGYYTVASGSRSTAVGAGTTAPSYAETVVGKYNTSYTPNSTDAWDNADRLFVIGNGTDDSHKSNALTIYKNGVMNINDAYNMPVTDGSNDQLMATNGAGQVSFVDASSIFSDNQTIDQFNLTGTILNLSIEDDGMATQTVDLSSLQDGTGTDDQIIDQFNLTGTTLNLSIENDGMVTQTVDLSSLSANTLDQAYDEGGPGAGRIINTTHGGVLLNGDGGLIVKGHNAGIEISNTAESSSGIHFRDSGNITQYANIKYDNSLLNQLKFYVNSNTSLMVLDDSQKVGIGTITPDYKLSVAGPINLNEGINSGGIALRVNGTEAIWYNGGRFNWGNGGTSNYFADKVGIGTSSPNYKLDVKDNTVQYVARINNTSTNSFADGLLIRIANTTAHPSNFFVDFENSTTRVGSITGSIFGGISYNTTSDRRLKTNIVSVKDALQIINKIQPRKYEFKANRGVEEYGFIAQELQTVYPQAVNGDPNGDVKTAPMMVDYSRLTPILTAGVKELDNMVNLLKNKNKALKKRLDNLEKRLTILEEKKK